jgi:DHA1 family bicyclomycin/chloramphenicol resistance-like MFS transporter
MNSTDSSNAPSAALRARLPLPLLSAIAALPPLAVDMYLPAFQQIADDLDTSISHIQLSLSLFLLGFGSGMLFWGPFADRYGRRPIAMLGLAGFGITSLLLSLTTDATLFLAFRLLQGLLGSAASVTVPAMVRDCYGKDTARGMSTVMMIMLVAPLLAPLLGSAVLVIAPWEGIFVFEALYPLLVLLACWHLLPETLPAQHEVPRFSLLGNYRIIFSKREIYCDLVSYMLSALTFFTYLTAVSFVYISYYGVSETLFGVLFAVSAFALILANYTNRRMVGRIGARRMLMMGLAISVLCAVLLCSISWLELGLWPTVAGFVALVYGLGIASVNADALVIMEFPAQASSASAVIGTLRFGTGALAGPILALLYTGTPLPVVLLMLCAVSGALFMQWLRQRLHPAQH